MVAEEKQSIMEARVVDYPEPMFMKALVEAEVHKQQVELVAEAMLVEQPAALAMVVMADVKITAAAAAAAAGTVEAEAKAELLKTLRAEAEVVLVTFKLEQP